MSRFKKETSPGRPPAPKLSLLREKQGLSTGSVAIKFNAASFDTEDNLEEEDVTLVTGQFGQGTVSFSDMSSKKVRNGETQKQHQSTKHKAQQILAFSSQNSHSAPVSPEMEKLNSSVAASSNAQPVSNMRIKESRITPFHEEERSLFSGIKERLQDKAQKNLTVLIGKIEEISGEKSGIGEALERRLRKAESLDSGRGVSTYKIDKNDTGIQEREMITFGESTRSRHSSNDSDVFGEYDALNDAKTDIRSNSEFTLQDFCAEPIEEEDPVSKQRPSSTSGISDIHHIDQSKSSKFNLKKWHSKNKDKRGGPIETSHSVPMSMSALLSQKEKTVDLEDELMQENKQEDHQEPSNERLEAEKDDLQGDLAHILEEEKTTDKMELPAPVQNKKSLTSKLFRHQYIISIIIALIAYIVIPLPSFVSGMVCGAAIALCLLISYQWLNKPAQPVQPFIAPDITNKPPLRVPEMKESKNIDGKFMGWMNELSFYDSHNYHIGNTKSVYVQLEGTNLRLQTPKQGIPKRAMWTEPSIYPASFIKQRFFDLTDSKIILLPEGLVSKRIWSKKYPICITLAKKGQKCKIDSKEQGTVNNTSVSEAKNLGYDVLTPGELCNTDCLYLFARTCREKEEWFHRFVAATKSTPLPTRLSELIERTNIWLKMKPSKSSTSMSSLEASHKQHKREGSSDSNISDVSVAKEADLYTADDFDKTLMEYIQYMTHLVPAEEKTNRKTQHSSSYIHGASVDSSIIWGTVPVVCEPSLMWVNAALGRLFFDFLREQYWADKVREKIQRKLSKIHVPYFIDELTVTGIDLGSQIPVIQRTSRPYIDDRGMWLDVDIAYGGGFVMSLETKVNLMKLKKSCDDPVIAAEEVTDDHQLNSRGCAITDSAEEDSAESSTDEEAEEEYIDDKLVQTEPAGKKFLKIVDRIAQSKYFQQATENKYIKKAMVGVSNTPLMLTVEMKSCAGTMALNIPPPPTDRLWYGFRSNPHLVLSAKPRVGEREVSFVHITEWIEKKLTNEFQRVLVMPNMDDLEIPLLCHAFYGDNTTAEEAQEAAEHKQHETDEQINIGEETEMDYIV